jgi:hypothetical protein
MLVPGRHYLLHKIGDTFAAQLMNSISLIIFVIIVLCVFIIRIIPPILWGKRALYRGDTMVHRLIIEKSKKNNHCVPNFEDQFLLTDSETYPTFYHQLLSFLSLETIAKIEPFIGAFLETLQAIFVFMASCKLAEVYWPTVNSFYAASLTTIMFGITPLLFENPARIFHMSERPFGVLMATVSLSGVITSLLINSTGMIIFSAIFVALTLLSSKFGAQALLFLSVGIAILVIDLRPLIILISGVGIALLISRFHYWDILRGHIHHSYLYKTYLADRNPATTVFNLKQLLLWPKTFVRSPVEAIRMLVTHYMLISFSLFAWVFPLAVSYLGWPQWLGGRVEKLLIIWVLAGFTAMMLTATQAFRFLGEPHRYVIYSVAPVCAITAFRLLSINHPVLWLVAAMALFVSIAGSAVAYVNFIKGENRDENIPAIYEFIAKLEPQRILTIDLRLSYVLSYRTSHQVVCPFTNFPGGSKLSQLKQLVPKWWPYPDLDLTKIIKDHQVNLLIVDQNKLDFIKKIDPTYAYDFSNMQPIFEYASFIVYDVTKSRDD